MNQTQERTIMINFAEGKEKSLVKISYILIYLDKKFNWLQKKMFKLLLGIDIEDVVKEVE